MRFRYFLEVVVEDVAEAVFFGAEVIDVVRRGGYLEGDLLDDFDAIDLEPAGFFGVVGEDFDLLEAEVAEDLSADAVIAFVGGKTKLDIRVNCIEALFLKLIGVEFIFEADTSTFLAEVNKCADTRLFNHLQCGGELPAAFTTLGAEEVAGHTFGVDADEDRLIMLYGFAEVIEVADTAFAKRQVRFGRGDGFVCDKLEVAEVGGQVHGFDAFNLCFSLEAVFD